jgi:hypothetical protein
VKNEKLAKDNAQLLQEIQDLTIPKKHSIIQIDINGHEGIIHYLRQQDITSVSIRASDNLSNPVQNLLSFDNSVWWNSGEKIGSFLIINFKNHKVKPTAYLLRSADKLFPQGWILEGSNDLINWSLLDKQLNQSCFLQPFQSCCFNCDSHGFFSFLRLKQIQRTKNESNWFGFSFVEFGGEI